MNIKWIALGVLSAVFLVGCPDDNHSRTEMIMQPDTGLEGAEFDVLVKNNTQSQPLSPLTVLSHSDNYALFTLGASASVPLEHLSEGGDNTALLATKNTNNEVSSTHSGVGVIAPGASQSVQFEVTDPASTHVTVASMLVNTNDAFVAEDIDLSTLSVGQSITVMSPVWDSGTEANTETSASIPGPAGTNGVGFSSVRDDIADKVTAHRGVVSLQDGLSGSALDATYRFLNPAASITVTRTK